MPYSEENKKYSEEYNIFQGKKCKKKILLSCNMNLISSHLRP